MRNNINKNSIIIQLFNKVNTFSNMIEKLIKNREVITFSIWQKGVQIVSYSYHTKEALIMIDAIKKKDYNCILINDFIRVINENSTKLDLNSKVIISVNELFFSYTIDTNQLQQFIKEAKEWYNEIFYNAVISKKSSYPRT